MTTATAHTSGRWEVCDSNGQTLVLGEPGADGGARVVAACGGYSADEHRANARLIAAAPELLACLRRMCGMYGAYSRRLAPLLAEDDGTVWTFERANSLAHEAIAKAEGRS